MHLEHIVLVNMIFLQIWQTRVLDDNTCSHVLGDHIVLYESSCLLLCEQATRVVVQDLIIFDHALGVDQHDSIKVIIDGVVIDEELVLTFDDEDALGLRVLDHVELDLGFAGPLAT